MVHRAQDSRLLLQLLKSDKEYSQALNALLSASQASLAALNAYASSCPPSHAQAMLGVVGALSAADDAFRNLVGSLDAWRADLKKVKGCEDVVANVLKDREILIGKLIKVSNKKSTRDAISASGPFSADPSLTLTNPMGGSSTTLTTGSAKLSHAQAELQACEAHLAVKEKELEETRQVVIRSGLERRCKALISCGWAWGERGKQALRALEAFGTDRATNGTDKTYPRASHDPNDSQLSSVTPSVTPSQSASQIALPVASDESHDVSTSAQHNLTSSLSPNAPKQNHPLPGVPAEPEPEFTLNIGPAHSIDDHGQIHDSIPSSRMVDSTRRTEQGVAGDSSDEAPHKPLEVHENDPFAKRQSSLPTATAEPVRASPERSRTLRRVTDHQKHHPNSSKISFPRAPGGTLHKPKPSSDLGPRSTFTPYEAPQHSPIKEGFGGGGLTRKRSTSFSLMNGIAGLFRSKKRSSSIERAYPVSTSTGGWHTRTDKHLERRAGNSSSEDELPSTLVRRSRMAEQNQGTDAGPSTDDQRRLSKRNSKSSHKKDHDSIKYTVVERPARSDLVRSASISSRKSGEISSDGAGQTAAETAANTNLNSGGSAIHKRASLPPPERPAWEGRSYSESIVNRLHNDTGTMSVSSPTSRPNALESITERQRRSEDQETGEKFTLPPPRLEVVRAPPSITTVPLLFNPNTSSLESPRSSTLKDQSTSGSSGAPAGSTFVRGHARSPSVTNARVPLDTGSSLVSKPSTSRDSPGPLKSALKSPPKATTPLPGLPSILVKRIEAEESGRRSTATPPTPVGAKEGLKPNGDSLFVPASSVSPPGLRSPPATASSLVPSPRRLSKIPGSNRSSFMEDDDSVYETAGEEEPDDSDTDREARPEEQQTPILSPVPMKFPSGVQIESSATPPIERMLFESKGEDVKDNSAEVSVSSTTSTSTPSKRKSVRMIIYPTAAVSAPEHYNDPITPMTDPPSSASTVRQVVRNDRNRAAGSWDTRINTIQNAWDDSSEEDEEYGRARRALARGLEPSGNDDEYQRGRQRSNRVRRA